MMITEITLIGAIVLFFLHQIYQVGRLTGKVSSLESDIVWIRNYLLTKSTDSKHFTQESEIKISDELANTIPLSWTDTLNGANIDIKGCGNPFDCVVRLSENQGAVRLKKRADDLNIEHNAFLLASGVYIFNRKIKR